MAGGAEHKGEKEPSVVWFEVVGKDGAKLRNFYSSLFGWQIADSGTGMDYGLVQAGIGGIGGGIGRSQDGGQGFVTVYVEVDDPAAYLKKAEKLGGKTVVPPTEIPEAKLTFAYFVDPEGHMIGLSKGAVQ
ncbi:MAG TPA: VOC family protein [Candidatus Dormibacteraeota bacterium]|nr:VOC family protein [Candidatus Dormibacteraeota bacterium]